MNSEASAEDNNLSAEVGLKSKLGKASTVLLSTWIFPWEVFLNFYQIKKA